MLQSRMSVEDEEAVQAELAAMEAEQVRPYGACRAHSPSARPSAQGADAPAPCSGLPPFHLPCFARGAQTRAKEGPREQKTVLPDVPASDIPAVREEEQDERQSQPEQGEDALSLRS